MKITEISPVLKKHDSTSKDNYRPINFIKLFESILITQLNRYMQKDFSKYLTGFRKNHNTQVSLLSMIESLESQTEQWIKSWSNNNGLI